MKTKTFLMVCLFMGIGLTQLSAQNENNGNGSDVIWLSAPMSLPVYSSNGEKIDQLSGWVTYNTIAHYEMGTFTWWKQYLYGEFVSEGFVNKKRDIVGGTGELFNIKTVASGYYIDNLNISSLHYNAIGSQGSHYIIFLDTQFDFTTYTYTITFVKAVSPGTE